MAVNQSEGNEEDWYEFCVLPFQGIMETKIEKEQRLFMTDKFLSGVVLKETFVKTRRKGIRLLVLMNLVYLVVIIGLVLIIGQEKGKISSFSYGDDLLEEYRTKEKLYGLLRNKGYSLGQGLDIVEAIAKRSRELRLPLALIMAVIDQESEFYPNAKSDKGAQGLMQIMPLKWDEYVVKLNLTVDRRAMTDPFLNITIGCQILKDLYDAYKHVKDDKARMARALTDYNNGEVATAPNLKYAIEVGRKQEEYQKKLQRQERIKRDE